MKKTFIWSVSVLMMAANTSIALAADSTELEALRAECAPFVKGQTSIDRKSELSRANLKMVGATSLQIITGLGTLVTGLGATADPSARKLAALFAGASAGEFLAFRKTIHNAGMTQSCLQALYPSEFPDRRAVSQNHAKQGASATTVVIVNTGTESSGSSSTAK